MDTFRNSSRAYIMTTAEELYENLPDAFKEIFTNKKKQEDKMKEEGKTPFDIMQETLEKIKAINKKKYVVKEVTVTRLHTS